MSLHETRSPVTSPGLIVIPSRLESRRLPRKLLLAETGQALLGYSIDIARRAIAEAPDLLSGPVVAADDELLLNIARDAGVSSILTKSSHQNGTSRVGEVLQVIPSFSLPPFVVNLQADHPELDPELLVQVSRVLLQDSACQMATAAVPFDLPLTPDFANPHVVKVDCDSDSHARRFFRLLPSSEEISTRCYRHLGIYSYRTDFLLKLSDMTPSSGSLREDLEQLTPLAMGARIRVVIVSASSAGHGIDTPEDYDAFVQRHSSHSASRTSGGAE